MGRRGSPFAAERAGIERRDVEIVRRYKAGEELASIGVDLDLTRERIRQIVRASGAGPGCRGTTSAPSKPATRPRAHRIDTATPTSSDSSASATH